MGSTRDGAQPRRTPPEVVRARAPLRISFAGGGTDIPPFSTDEGGAVLSTTINRYAYASLRLGTEPGTRVQSVDYGTTATFETSGHLAFDGTLDLPKAALRYFGIQDRLEIVLVSNAPPGSGLGASSALTVALVAALNDWLGAQIDLYELAELAHHVERDILGVPGGQQDHYAAAFGGINYIEFGSQCVVNPLRISDRALHELEASLLLCDTGLGRYSGNVIQDQQDRVMGGDQQALDGLRRQKVLAQSMKTDLLRSRIGSMAEHLRDAWEAKRAVSPLISNARIDELYDTALAAGASGAKLCGAGAGGHLAVITPFERREAVTHAMTSAGATVRDVAVEQQGVVVWRP